MKKRISLALFSASVMTLALFSCKDFLRVEPTNVLSVNSYENVRAMLGAHLKMIKTGQDRIMPQTTIPFVDDTWTLTSQFYADDLKMDTYLSNWMGMNNRGLFNKSVDWQNPDIHERVWMRLYSNIGFYNMILHELSNYPAATPELQSQVEGEARILRAMTFFKLVQLFSPYHEAQLGLPLNTDPEAVGSYDKRRQTQAENYNFITSELESALAMSNSPSESYNLYLDKNIIHALLAQVYLYKGDSGAKGESDYKKAIDHAKAAIQGGKISPERIDRMPTADASYGYTKTNGYALLSFLYSNHTLLQDIYGFALWGAPQYPTDELYNLFPDNDRRKAIYFGDKKAITKNNSDFLSYFYPYDFFTAAELQLIIAESLVRSGRESEGLEVLKDFTKFRYDSYEVPAGKSVLEAILIERRKEFCFEGDFRWHDLHRLQPSFSRKVKGKNGQEKVHTMKEGDYRYCMPIPKNAELANNKIDQNPGWGTF